MERYIVFDPSLTKPDRLVLEDLVTDLQSYTKEDGDILTQFRSTVRPKKSDVDDDIDSGQSLKTLSALGNLNNPESAEFEPTIFTSIDYNQIQWNEPFKSALQAYLRIARSIVRYDTDVVMLTLLLLYFLTSVPSALTLYFWRFTWIHGILHFAMQVSYMGTYTLMMHQHIHQRGILKKEYWAFDHVFPYIINPLMGHTWNSYYYHHIKHHHVEANGPSDLSSTIRYQRDSILHLLHYICRFFLFIWLDLPLYFIRSGRLRLAMKVAFWELGSYFALALAYSWNPKSTICVFLLPLVLLRIGLMVGNWGQHAFVDDTDPTSDYRMSITLLDVQSNRYSFNDGYHTSHHLNPLRHWREHPKSFLQSKQIYASQNALVMHNIDYIMITIKLMQKDYQHLAKCMIPIGKKQIDMSLNERADLLKRHTRRFTEAEIRQKFKSK